MVRDLCMGIFWFQFWLQIDWLDQFYTLNGANYEFTPILLKSKKNNNIECIGKATTNACIAYAHFPKHAREHAVCFVCMLFKAWVRACCTFHTHGMVSHVIDFLFIQFIFFLSYLIHSMTKFNSVWTVGELFLSYP